MVFIFKLCIFFSVFIVLFHFLTRKYVNPYRLIMYIGKKGSGKSTTIAKLVRQYNKKGRPCYSTMRVQGAFLIDYQDIGFYRFPAGSVIFVDEVGMIWDNRNYKNFKPEVRDYFKLQRHYQNTFYLFSQSFDVDKKLRDLCDELWITVNKFRVFSYSRRVIKKITIVEAQGEGESRVTENYQWDSFLFFFLGSRKLTFIPKYIKYFDSFEIGVNIVLRGEFIPYEPEKKFFDYVSEWIKKLKSK